MEIAKARVRARIRPERRELRLEEALARAHPAPIHALAVALTSAGRLPDATLLYRALAGAFPPSAARHVEAISALRDADTSELGRRRRRRL